MLQALLFDLDGTLTDTAAAHCQAWGEELLPYGFNVDDQFFRQHIVGRLNPDIVQDLLPKLSPTEGNSLIEHKEARFRELAWALLPVPGVVEVIKLAQSHHLKQALVTNAPRKNADHMLTVLGLEGVFAAIVIGDDLPRGKPDPLPYQTALDRLQVNSTAAMAFEDSVTGIRSAVGAGILTVGVATAHTPEDLLAGGATIAIADFTDPQLLNLLPFLNSLG